MAKDRTRIRGREHHHGKAEIQETPETALQEGKRLRRARGSTIKLHQTKERNRCEQKRHPTRSSLSCKRNDIGVVAPAEDSAEKRKKKNTVKGRRAARAVSARDRR